MIIAALLVLGLCFGSFDNALVWRLHELSKPKKQRVASDAELSISRGRSMCPDCQHSLAWYDLVPVVSWLSVGGRCRYCHKPIAIQYPLVELATAGLFVLSYMYWPAALQGSQWAVFGLWLALLVGLMALLIYDLRWLLLPNKLVYPLTGLAAAQALIGIVSAASPVKAALNTLLAVVVGSGLFYVLFQVSDGKWIGGGDVKLGWIFGLVVASPLSSFLVIFLASLIGSLVAVPLLLTKRLKKTSVIAFGPFLIIATIGVQLFGADLLVWYQRMFFVI